MLMVYWDRWCQAGIDGSWQLYAFWKTNGGSSAVIEATSVRHNKFGNVAFADGHVASALTLKNLADLEATRSNATASKRGITSELHATIPMP